MWSRLLALTAIVAWPLIPISWLQIHSRSGFWRGRGALTYVPILLEWFAVALLLLALGNSLVGARLDLGAVRWAGLMIALLGVALQAWTTYLLGWRTLVGFHELMPQATPQKLVTKGFFSAMRHPAYLSHTLFFLGVFLLTEYTGAGVLTAADFLTSYFLIIPLEERELQTRFGEEYQKYKKRVPKFLPLRFM
jgi:protein-S-isoprenylcysteine O-methyltransferase Ste14